MSSQGRTNNIITDGLGLSKPRTLTVGPLARRVEISKIFCGPDQTGMTAVIPPTDAFALGIFLNDIPYHEIWRRGRPVIRQGYAAKSMQLADLLEGYSANVCSAHEVVAFSIPRAVLDEVSYETSRRRAGTIACEPGTIDQVIVGLVSVLLPEPHCNISCTTTIGDGGGAR